MMTLENLVTERNTWRKAELFMTDEEAKADGFSLMYEDKQGKFYGIRKNLYSWKKIAFVPYEQYKKLYEFMAKSRIQKANCSNCEYTGKAVFPILNHKQELLGFGNKLGYNDYGMQVGGGVEKYPLLRCEHEKRAHSLISELEALPCKYWKQRTWERPSVCGECKFFQNGNCSGTGFTGIKVSKEKNACVNGRKSEENQEQIEMEL